MTNHEQPLPTEPERPSSAKGGQEARFSPKMVQFADIACHGDEFWIEYQGAQTNRSAHHHGRRGRVGRYALGLAYENLMKYLWRVLKAAATIAVAGAERAPL